MGGKSGGVTYTQRDLSPEERQLISTQTGYINSLQPAINQLVSRGTAQLGNVITPDYGTMYSNAQTALNNNVNSINQLASGQLPNQYAANQQAYYNTMYNNSLGQSLANAAKRGVIGGSALGKSIDSMQKNFAAQASADYGKNLQTQSGLLTQQQQAAYQPLALGSTANQASFGNAANYLGLAAGKNLGSQGTDVLNAVGNLNNNSSAFVQNSGKGLL